MSKTYISPSYTATATWRSGVLPLPSLKAGVYVVSAGKGGGSVCMCVFVRGIGNPAIWKEFFLLYIYTSKVVRYGQRLTVDGCQDVPPKGDLHR